MKAGIITIRDNINYGNRLQNYAVSILLKGYGIEATTIFLNNKEVFLSYKHKNWIKRLLPIHLLLFCSMLNKWLHRDKPNIIREKNFCEFNDKYIDQKIYSVNRYKQMIKIKELQEYDYFLAGSDQIWNPNFAGTDLYFLTFAPPEKRIAFIASIGINELPDKEAERYKVLLSKMKYISVREEKAVTLIEQLIGKKVDCFLDPVLLISKDKWSEIAEAIPHDIPSNYILSFFLGDEPEENIKKLAEKRQVSVIHMNQEKYREYYSLNPAQLLYLIKNAEFVLTDSFHVTAFSIIFQKQFYVFRRKQEGMEGMFSRMETLLGKLGLIYRVQDGIEIEDKDVISKEQYDLIEKKLVDEQKRFNEIMSKILK